MGFLRLSDIRRKRGMVCQPSMNVAEKVQAECKTGILPVQGARRDAFYTMKGILCYYIFHFAPFRPRPWPFFFTILQWGGCAESKRRSVFELILLQFTMLLFGDFEYD